MAWNKPRRQQPENPNWSAWETSVNELRPGPPHFRWFLELGGIDPSAHVAVRRGVDRRSGSAPPIFFLRLWSAMLRKLRPPSEGPFHRLWKRRRQQAMRMLPAGPAAAAAVTTAAAGGGASPGGEDDHKDHEEDEDGEVEVCEPRQKRPRLTVFPTAADSSSLDSSLDSRLDTEEQDEELQANSSVEQLLELLALLQHQQKLERGIPQKPVPAEPLSSLELQELAALFPGGQELSAEELATKVRESKTELILELVLEDRVRSLLEFGAQPNPEPGSARPYHADPASHPLAAEFCPPSVLRLLLEAKADPNWALVNGYDSALTAHMRSPESLRLLLEAGANPHHGILTWVPGRAIPPITGPVDSSLFLKFMSEGAPAESLRMLLEHNSEICGNRPHNGGSTPLSAVLPTPKPPRHVIDLALKLPFPIPAICSSCHSHRNCWQYAASKRSRYRPTRSLKAMVQIGYPTRGGMVQEAIRRVRTKRFSSIYIHKPGSLGANIKERLDILESMTEEAQARRRQEHLGGFWSVIMQAVPSLSGVVASLVLQAIVPEFRLRIV